MIKIHFRVKARAFGITFGTIEDSKDVSGVLVTVLSNVLPKSVGMLLPELGKLPAPIKIYDDRGVFIELV